MVVGINAGHTTSGPGSGAVGLFRESEHTRYIALVLAAKLKVAGVKVVDCTIDQAESQEAYLERVVTLANRQDLDWFISIHFNASADHQGRGCEVYTYEGRQYQDALDVCKNMEKLGFTNRGVKVGTGLYVIKKTKAKSMLIEVCFCDNQADTELYVKVTIDKVIDAIYNALYPYTVTSLTGNETPIMGESVATADQLRAYLLLKNPQATAYAHLPEIYLEEGEAEGVRGDGAFCQACKETGFFKFGGDVQPDQHNYCGLGATGGVSGLSFPDDRTGVKAQIQHLKGYATTEPVCGPIVDPRLGYIKLGCAPTFEQLSGKWAVPGYSGYLSFVAAWQAQDTYGHHITKMLREAELMVIPEGKSVYTVEITDVWEHKEIAEGVQEQLESIGVSCIVCEKNMK